jgi:hypothetical protein
VRSLSPQLRQQAVLLPKAPSDLVTGNRTAVREGNQVIPLAGIWRDTRFRDNAEQDKLQAASDSIDHAAGYTSTDHEAVAYSAAPKGAPAGGTRRLTSASTC